MNPVLRKQAFCICKTKMQISCAVTDKLTIKANYCYQKLKCDSEISLSMKDLGNKSTSIYILMVSVHQWRVIKRT